MASLCQIRDDGSAADRWEIRSRPLLAGRGDAASVRVEDAAVSREHFIIARDRDGYVIEDLDSRNGTWVDGRKISLARLHSSDCIVAGRTIFIFEDEARPAAATGTLVRTRS